MVKTSKSQTFRVQPTEFAHALQFLVGLLSGTWLRITLFFLLPAAALEAGVVMATRAALELVVSMHDVGLPFGRPDRLALVLIAIIIFLLLRIGCATYLWSRVLRHVSVVKATLSTQLFSSYLHLPYVDLVSGHRLRMFENLRVVSSNVLQDNLTSILVFVSEVMIAIAVLIVLLVLAPAATVVLICWFAIVFGVLFVLVTRLSRRSASERWQAQRAMQALDEWTFRQVRSVRLAGEEASLIKHHHDLSANASTVMSRIFLVSGFPRYIGELALLSSMMLLLAWFAIAGHEPSAVLRDLAMFTVAAMRLLPAGQRAVSIGHQLQQSLPELQELVKDLNCAKDLLPSPAPLAEGQALFHDELELSDIGFGYPGQKSVIPVSTHLVVRRGEWLLVRGPSGVGKSTLVSLLLGLLTPSSGCVKIDGKPQNPLAVFRGRAIALVAQDTRLLTGTLAKNLSFPGTEAELAHDDALALMQALGLDWQLDMPISDDGANLSGGQRQRLAIVKALLHKPQLLVMDEATSQLDAANERAVFNLVREHLPKATVIVVAHKLDNSGLFDRLWDRHGQVWVDTHTQSNQSESTIHLQ